MSLLQGAMPDNITTAPLSLEAEHRLFVQCFKPLSWNLPSEGLEKQEHLVSVDLESPEVGI